MNTYRNALDPGWKAKRRDIYKRYWLHTLGTVTAITLVVAFRPISISKITRKLFGVGKLERYRLNQALQRLERRGLVRRQKRDDGNEYLLLTEAGERAYKHEKRRELSLRHPVKWDKKWRIVVFDIEENKKTIRDAMRRHLRKLGFYPLQKSVFVTPYPCEDEICFLQEFYEAESEICLIEATSLGVREKAVRKFFER